MDDFEERRSVRSFQSLYSMRSSRSQPGPSSAELCGGGGGGGDIARRRQLNGSHTNMVPPAVTAMMAAPRRSKQRSQSADNVTLVAPPGDVLAPVETRILQHAAGARVRILETSI